MTDTTGISTEYVPWPDVVPTEWAQLLLAEIRSNQYLLPQRLAPDNVTLALERIIQTALDAYKIGKPLRIK